MREGAYHSLVLPFDRDSRDFVLGVEVGRLWEMLKAAPDEELEQTAHGDNAEMMLRIAEALRRPVRSEELDDNWITVTFAPSEGDVA